MLIGLDELRLEDVPAGTTGTKDQSCCEHSDESGDSQSLKGRRMRRRVLCSSCLCTGGGRIDGKGIAGSLRLGRRATGCRMSLRCAARSYPCAMNMSKCSLGVRSKII